MRIDAYGLSDPGKVRKNNEDAFFIGEANQLFAVADGLGGLPGGAEASQRVMELLAENLNDLAAEDTGAGLFGLINDIHQIVVQEAFHTYPVTGSGSTLTLLRIIGENLLIAHIGDSSAFLLRDGKLEKLTVDHTLEQELVTERGEAARKDMPTEYSHTLTRCLGQQINFHVDQTKKTLRSKDRLILCTDGLTRVVPLTDIAQTLAANLPPEAITHSLIDQANARSGPDNITVITLIIS